MKIIDEKGRLFAKINVIDFLVILFLLCLMPMFYFGYKILAERVEIPKEEFVEIETDCRLIKLEPEQLQLISIGDKELDEDGKVLGEIVSLGEVEPYVYELDIGQEQRIIKQDPLLKQITAKLKLKAEVRQNSLYYKDKQIAINSPLDFKTDKYKITAIPEAEEVEEVEERILDLYVTLKDLDEDTSKRISVGDKEVDENGKVIAEILNLGKIENSSLEFNLGSGHFVRGQDSNKKQISTKMRLRCQLKDGNQLYFKGKRIESNRPFEFETDKYKALAFMAKTFETISPLKEKWASLQVEFSGVIPQIAKIIEEGDLEKDVSGKAMARIRTVVSNRPSEVLTLKEDRFITLSHPFQRDIIASLDALCIEKEGTYYFKNYPVKMGNPIVFATDLYSISGTIIGVEIE